MCVCGQASEDLKLAKAMAMGDKNAAAKAKERAAAAAREGGVANLAAEAASSKITRLSGELKAANTAVAAFKKQLKAL